MSKTLYHKHHIIPKHAGGTDDSSNIVYITVEEHAEAHRILFEQYGRTEDYLAWKGLSGRKEEFIRARCSFGGKKGGKKLLGKPKSEIHKQRVSEGLRGKKQTPEHKANVARSLSGSNSSCSMTFRFVSPSGDVYVTKGFNQFCRSHNLGQGTMHQVSSGKRRQHKGWTCEKVTDDTL